MKNAFLGISEQPLFTLFSAIYPQDRAEALASGLLKSYGSLAGILKINPEVLEADIGREAALYLRLSLSLFIRSITERTQIGDIVTEAVLARHFSAFYADAAEEIVCAVLLDREDALLAIHRVAVGSADASSFQPRQVLELAVRAKANGVILTHNHPGGTLTASVSDKKMTEAVATALEAARIRFLGHYIFADTGFSRIGDEDASADAPAPSLQSKEIR